MKQQSTHQENLKLNIGCAGWSVPKSFGSRFPDEGSHLERYAGVFGAVEINSSFYRPHQPATYERWKDAVPGSFRFALKVPKVITHTRRLKDIDEELAGFLTECTHLDTKLGVLLVQLPPSLAFDVATTESFFTTLRALFEGDVAVEPRHRTWFTREVDFFLSGHRVARVAADPALTPEAAVPAGWNELVYYRLHGSPRIYYSAYSQEYLEEVASKLMEARANGARVWCIFDNTAEGAATGDALTVIDRIEQQGSGSPLR